MAAKMNRRKFLGTAAASTAAVTILPRHALGGPGYVAPSDKITLAYIGVGTQGLREMAMLLPNPEVQIVAVCDPNKDSTNYVDWSKNGIRDGIRKLLGNPSWGEGVDGIRGGREVGREVVDTYYANQRSESFMGCASYTDFRELLEKEKDLNAVKIMTPDHLHATIAIAAMKKGKAVLMHKPIANRLAESRMVIETARQTKVATHFQPWNNGESIRLIASWIKDGVIGTLREVHNWSSRPMWPQYSTIPTDTPPIPKDFDWDLWLGPALYRPYHPHYTHAVFRGWYDFGGGSLADMGHYSLWSVFTVFNLGAPISIEATPTHTCTLVDQVSVRQKNDYSFPAACTIRFKFAARGDRPPFDIVWYDGGIRPSTPEELDADNKEMPSEGMMFVGDKGKILADFRGRNPRIIPEKKMLAYQGAQPIPQTPQTPPQPEGGGQPAPNDRDKQWVEAFKGGTPSAGNFLNATAISDAINLGAVALRAGKRIFFDAEKMQITNITEANKYLYREYRKGWEL
jgi:predicted dehydrogenase